MSSFQLTTSQDGTLQYNILIAHQPNQGNINNPSPSAHSPSLVKTSITSSTNIVSMASEWYLSVTRFDIPGSLLPIFVFPVTTNPEDPTDVNYSPLTVTLAYDLSTAPVVQQHLEFFPLNTAEAPNPPGYPSIAHSNAPYYYVYEINHMLQIVNNALSDAFDTLTAGGAPSNPGSGAPDPQAPYFIYDSNSQLISLVVQRIYYDLTLDHPIKIYLNSQLIQYFQAISTTNLAFDDPDGMDYQINVWSTGANYYTPQGYLAPTMATDTPTYPYWYQITQEWCAFSYWCDFTSLMLTVTNLPVRMEYIPNNAINNPAISANFSANSNQSPILTDFVPDVQKPGDLQNKFIYNPTGPYRLIDLLGQQAVKNFDIQVWWVDRFNNLNPLYISAGQVCTIKMSFFKRNSLAW